jgi:hypothetical protein
MKLTHAQRDEIPKWSLSYAARGWGDGSGYPGRGGNPACKYVGHGLEYSCADGVTTTFGKAAFPLISMQPGMSEGYAYCPDALIEGRKRNAVINSWTAQVGDILLIDTGGGAQPGHTEVIYDVQGSGATRRVFSVGWDSGPSNVDHFTGQGGVHRHVWSTPTGKGSAAIMAVLDADKVIDWAKVGQPAHAPAKAKRKKLKPAVQHKTEHSKVTAPPKQPKETVHVKTIQKYAKAHTALVGAVGTWAAVALQDGRVSTNEWVALGYAIATALGVALVPNKKTP